MAFIEPTGYGWGRDEQARWEEQMKKLDGALENLKNAPTDPVNHPAHYKVAGFEVIDIIEAFGLNFRLANVIKYVLRADRKGNRLQDLEKALWYLSREIAKAKEAK